MHVGGPRRDGWLNREPLPRSRGPACAQPPCGRPVAPTPRAPQRGIAVLSRTWRKQLGARAQAPIPPSLSRPHDAMRSAWIGHRADLVGHARRPGTFSARVAGPYQAITLRCASNTCRLSATRRNCGHGAGVEGRAAIYAPAHVATYSGQKNDVATYSRHQKSCRKLFAPSKKMSRLCSDISVFLRQIAVAQDMRLSKRNLLKR
jgi:hypothetical protein